MSLIILPLNVAKDAVLVEQKFGTSFVIEDGGNSITVDDGGGSLTVDFAPEELYLEISKGNIPGHSVIHKFGHNDAVGTTIVPVSASGVYQTPTTAQSLELISTATTDNQAGIGARTVSIEGLDASYAYQAVVANMHATDGTVAEAVTGTWTRVYRMHVEDSGTYASSAAGSHQGTITLQNSGGGVAWASLETHGGFPLGQSQIGAYTVPAGKTCYVGHLSIETDSSKAVDLVFFQRESANVIAAPYSAMRGQAVFTGITDTQDLSHKTWRGPYLEYTDLGFMAARSSAGSSSVSVDFEIIEVTN
jgi:hypothetical protein